MYKSAITKGEKVSKARVASSKALSPTFSSCGSDECRAQMILAMIFNSSLASKKTIDSKSAVKIKAGDQKQVVAFTDARAMAYCLPWFLGYLERQQKNPEAKALRELIVASANAAEKVKEGAQGKREEALKKLQDAYNSAVGAQASSQQDDDQKQHGFVRESKTPAQQVTAAFSRGGVFVEAAAQIRNPEAKIQDIDVKDSTHIQTIVAEALIHNEENVIDGRHGLISKEEYDSVQEVKSLDNMVQKTPMELVILLHKAGYFKGQKDKTLSLENIGESARILRPLIQGGGQAGFNYGSSANAKGALAVAAALMSKKEFFEAVLVPLHKENHRQRHGTPNKVAFFAYYGGVWGGGLTATAGIGLIAAALLATAPVSLPIAVGIAVVAVVGALFAGIGYLVTRKDREHYGALNSFKNNIETHMHGVLNDKSLSGGQRIQVHKLYREMIEAEGNLRLDSQSLEGQVDGAGFIGMGKAIVEGSQTMTAKGRVGRHISVPFVKRWTSSGLATKEAKAVAAYIESNECDWTSVANFLASDVFYSQVRTHGYGMGRREGIIHEALVEKIQGLDAAGAVELLMAVASKQAEQGDTDGFASGATGPFVAHDVMANALAKGISQSSVEGVEGLLTSTWFKAAGSMFSGCTEAQRIVLEAIKSARIVNLSRFDPGPDYKLTPEQREILSGASAGSQP